MQVGRWCTGDLEPDKCKTCFEFEHCYYGTHIVHVVATGFYQEPMDELGRIWRQGLCDRPGCKARGYAAAGDYPVVEYATRANSIAH